MDIKSKIRTIPNFPVKGVMFRDISTLFSDSDGLRLIVKNFQERYEQRDDIDIIIGIESRGFIVGSLLAYVLNKGFVMIRKPGKLPGKTIKQEYQLEYGADELEIHADSFLPGTKVLLVDDLIATGGTVMAAISLIERLDGIITETAFIIDLPEIGGSKKLRKSGYDVYTLTEFEGK